MNDSHGDPTTINEAVGSSVARIATIAYDPTFVHLPDTITTPGLTTTFTYDSNGEVLTKTLTDTTTQTVPYSTSGTTRVWKYTWQNSLLASVQSPRTDVTEKTSYTYDATGALATTTNPLNQVTTISSHTGGGLPLTIVDPNNVTTNLTYDPRQHLLTKTVVTSSGNRLTTYGYDAAENLTSVTQPDGSELTYTYDAAHRLTNVTDLFGQKMSYTLDALGDSTATDVYNASGTITKQHSNTYDALGRMLKDIGASNQTSSYTYDAMGNMLTAADQSNNTTQRAFDALNHLNKITDPESGITSTSYDAHDRPLTVTTPLGGSISYVYDGFGDLIQETSPNSRATVYYYDSAGNLTERKSPTGGITQYAYDALDRVSTMTFPSDTYENVSYTYDESGHGSSIGRLSSVADDDGTLSRSYDQLGNLVTDSRIKTETTLNTVYTYDLANRIASITYPSGALVSYTRDIMGRVTAVTAKPSGGTSTPVVSSVAYESFGPYSGLTFGNGVAETRSFDQDYRLTVLTDAGTNTLQSLSYGYYPTNNVQTITNGVTPANNQSFSYDTMQRLSQATGGYGTYGFTYDKDGNRLTQTLGGVTTNYAYGTKNDLLGTISMSGVTTQTINYTGDGNMANLNPGIQAPGGATITDLGWNQNQRLSAVKSGSTVLASYGYDGFGQRAFKTIPNTSATLYEYGQDGMLLEETAYKGTPLADYIYLDGRPIATLTPSGTLYFLQDDMLGTPQLATDSSQNPAWQATYTPFGQASVSGTLTQNLRLPGQYYDFEGGWNHNGFRNYLPDMGRYMEPDAIGMLGSSRFYSPETGHLLSIDPVPSIIGRTEYYNRDRFIRNAPIAFVERSPNGYAYVMNNPEDYRDPLGLWQITITVGWGYGVRFTFGNNGGSSDLAGLINGQWNAGFYAGVGEGLSIDADLFDRGCHSRGTNWGVEGAGELGLGPHIEGEAHVGNDPWGNINYGIPGTLFGGAIGTQGITVPTLAVGESAIYGIGGTHYF